MTSQPPDHHHSQDPWQAPNVPQGQHAPPGYYPPPGSYPPAKRGLSPGRIVALVILGLATIPMLFGGYMFVQSLTWGEQSDPHGYVRIFSFLLFVPALFVFLAALPFTLPPRYRLAYAFIFSLVFLLVVALYMLYVRSGR